MNKLNIKELNAYVETNIGSFHKKRLEKLEKLDFKEVLKRKNPYLFKAKNILTAQDLVKNLLDAFLLSQEETLFGDFMEGLAIFVCQKVFGGQKTTDLVGIDLEFVKNETRYVVEIKSGPHWGNSSQIKKMQDNFKTAKAILAQRYPNQSILAVNGCCYGVDNQPDKGDYFKYCGQAFWAFISDNPQLYIELIEPLGHKAKEQNDEFAKAYAKVINQFTLKFAQEFCLEGEIQWAKIVQYNSQKN